jgi:hypothetical protein
MIPLNDLSQAANLPFLAPPSFPIAHAPVLISIHPQRRVGLPGPGQDARVTFSSGRSDGDRKSARDSFGGNALLQDNADCHISDLRNGRQRPQ